MSHPEKPLPFLGAQSAQERFAKVGAGVTLPEPSTRHSGDASAINGQAAADHKVSAITCVRRTPPTDRKLSRAALRRLG